MKPECEQAINAAAGRQLSKAEYDGIEQRLKSSMLELRAKDPAAFSKMSPSQRAAGAAKLAKERMLADVVDAHERTITNAGRKAKTFADIDSVKPGLKGQTMHVKNLIVSLQREVEGGVGNYLRRITGLHEADGGKLFGMLQDKARQDDVARVLFGEKASDPKAQAAGDSLKNQLLDPLADAYRRAGLPLHKLDDWAVPQPHDVAKVAASEQAFVDDHMQLVDKSKYLNADGSHMTDEQLRHFLGQVWLTKATDGANKRAEGTGSGKAMVGSSTNAPRQVHYKDFASWKTAMEKYGSSTNLYDIVNSHVHKMTKDMVMAEHFGQDADGTIRQALARAKVADTLATSGKDDRAKVARLADQTQRIYDAYVHPQKPGNAAWANVGAQVRGIIAATQLGKLFTALPDLAGSKMAMEFNGLPQVRGFRDSLGALPPTAANLRTLHNLGLWFEDFQHAQRRMAEENIGSGIGTFLNEATHRAMGLNAFDRGLRAGNGSAAMNMLGHVTRAHADLAKADGESRLLHDAGVTQDHWNVWRLAELDRGPQGQHTLLTPAAIDAIPNAKLDPVIEQRIAARSEIFAKEIAKRDAAPTEKNQEYADAFRAKFAKVLEEERAKAKDDAQRKLLQVAYSQMQFGARGASGSSIQDHVAFGLDKLPAGTVMGELARFALQFKAVPLGIFAAHYRALGNSDYKWGAKASHAARFVAYSTLMGAVAAQISNLIAGQNPGNMNPAGKDGMKFWAEAMAKGGGLGFYGDVLFGQNAANRGAEAFMGPGVGAAVDLYKEFAQAKKDAETEGPSRHNYSLAALRWVRHNAAPLANIWYLKSAFNRLVYDQMAEYLAPGTNAKQERQAEQRGASYFWGPGSTSPSAPDLSKAWQP